MQTNAFILNTAFTGAVSDKSKNPNVPYTVDEIVADAKRCVGHGTAIGHFHVRTDEGAPTNDPDRYARLIAGLRSEDSLKDLIVVASTSGRHGQTIEERCAVLKLPMDERPDMGSLTLSSLNFATGPSVTSPDGIRKLAETMLACGVKPELEVFDLGMLSFAHQLIHEGLIEGPFYINIILGNQSGAMPRIATVAALMSELPENAIVSFGGIARHQVAAHRYAVAVAGGARTGLEDNLVLDRNRTLADNATLTQRLAAMATSAQRSIATAREVRDHLGLKQRG